MPYVIQRGESIVFTVDAVAIECLKQSDMSSSADKIDTTCKNAAGTTSSEIGALTTTFSLSGNYTEGSGSNKDVHQLWVLHRARTQFVGKWGGVDTGDKTYSGNCKIMTMNITAGNVGTLVEWTAEVEVQGDITVATVS